MPAVPCQPQTEAVFISHVANWPAGLLGCWARSSAGCYVPARDDLLVWLLCLPVCLLLACPVSVFLPVRQSLTDSLSVFLSDYSPGCLSAASLDVSHPVTFFFFLLPLLLPVSLAAVAAGLSVSPPLSGRLLSFCLPGCLSGSSGFPAEGCLDRCRITRTPQTHHSHTRKEAGKGGWEKMGEEEEEAVIDERRGKWRKRRRRGTGREHTVREGVQRQGRSEHMEIDLHWREQMDRWEKRVMAVARWEMGRQRRDVELIKRLTLLLY